MMAKFKESSRICIVLCCLSFGHLLAAERTKWCASESCLEPLFESTVTRDFSHSDPQFLKLALGMNLKITSFMYSDRVDLMGAISFDGRLGKIYKNFIDHRPLVEFLKSAIESNREFYVVADVDGPIKKAEKVANYTPLLKMYENKLQEIKEEKEKAAANSGEKAELVKNEPATITPSPPTSAPTNVETAHEPVRDAATATSASASSDESVPPTNVKIEKIIAEPTEVGVTVEEPEDAKFPETATPEKITAAPSEPATPETVAPTAIPESVPVAPIEATTPEIVASVGSAGSVTNDNEQTTTEYPAPNNQPIQPETPSPQNENQPKIDPVIVRRAVKSTVAADRSVSSEPSVPQPAKNQASKKNDPIKLMEPIQAIKDKINLKVNAQPTVAQSQQEQQPIEDGMNVAPSLTMSPEIEAAPSSMAAPVGNSEHQKSEEVITTTPLPIIHVEIPITAAQILETIPYTTPILENILSTVAPVAEVIPEDPRPVLVDPSSTVEIKNDENKENNNVDAPVEEFTKNLTNAINNINKKHEKTDKENRNVVDIIGTENPQIDRPSAVDIKSADDSSKYCHKETCNSISEAMLADSLKSLDALHNSTLRLFLNAYVDDLRLLLPYPFSTFDTTGIIVFAFLIVVFTIRLISAALSGSGPQRDVVDKRMLHDCMTRLKEQEVELTKSRVHASNSHQLAEAKGVVQKLHALTGELTEKNANLDKKVQKQADLIAEYDDKLKQNARQVQDLENALRAKEREIENLNENVSGLITRNDALSGELSTALGQLESLRNEKESLEFEFQMTREKLMDVSKKLQLTETELVASKESNNDLQKHVDQCMIIIHELQQKSVAVTSSPSKKSKRGGNTDAKSADSSDSSGNVIVKKASNVLVAAENGGDTTNGEQDENGAGSGGSTAWSDFSEVDEPDGANKAVEDRPSRKASTESMTRRTKSTARAELFEIAELKSRIRVLESERDALLTTVAIEKKEKEGLSERLEQLKSDLADKRREAEQREAERFALQSQCQKMLHMVEERDNKAHEKEEQLKQLHERISQGERELRKVEDEKREVASRVRELENSLRKAEDMNTKLENKIYHEDRRLNGKISQLETQLSKFHSLSPNASGLSDLNLSGNSSDRDFSLPVGNIPSLWSDIGSDTQYDSLNDLDRYRPNVSNLSNNAGSSRHRSSRKSLQMLPPSSNADMSGGELSSRASPFELEQIWMNRNNSVKEKRTNVTYRARSRSAGRQSVPSGRQSARLVGLVPSPSSNLNLLR